MPSAITLSPSPSKSKYAQCFFICLSVDLPASTSDIKITVPPRAIPASAYAVF